VPSVATVSWTWPMSPQACPAHSLVPLHRDSAAAQRLWHERVQSHCIYAVALMHCTGITYLCTDLVSRGVGDWKVQSLNGDAERDAAFLSLLVDSSSSSHMHKAGSSSAAAPDPAALQLCAGNVAKVVKGGAVGLSFMPSTSACVLAVTDKHGHVRSRHSCEGHFQSVRADSCGSHAGPCWQNRDEDAS
jgi:hypothetical protein